MPNTKTQYSNVSCLQRMVLGSWPQGSRALVGVWTRTTARLLYDKQPRESTENEGSDVGFLQVMSFLRSSFNQLEGGFWSSRSYFRSFGKKCGEPGRSEGVSWPSSAGNGPKMKRPLPLSSIAAKLPARPLGPRPPGLGVCHSPPTPRSTMVCRRRFGGGPVRKSLPCHMRDFLK